MDKARLTRMLDATVLAPQATYRDIDALCDEARKHEVWSVCVNPLHVQRAGANLRGSDTAVCSVVGFPLGATRTATKVQEARYALEDGASELDMVMNIGAFLAGDLAAVEDDIRAVVRVAEGRIVKVIIEITLLTDEGIVRAAKLVSETGASFVKTQTGWAQTRNTTPQDIRLIKGAIAPGVRVKASGGTRSWEAVSRLLEAGAVRFGVRVQDVEGILASCEGG